MADGFALARDRVVGELPLGLLFMTDSIDSEGIERTSAIDSASLVRSPFASELLIADVERALAHPGATVQLGDSGRPQDLRRDFVG
jgi:hypothetical protein